jgi:hypothetical protein
MNTPVLVLEFEKSIVIVNAFLGGTHALLSDLDSL